jgi:uncharacterized damage-inducible protein DinB
MLYYRLRRSEPTPSTGLFFDHPKNERNMKISTLLLPEFDQEMAVTRRILERVPDDKGQWKPHEKSFPMGHLAQLVARLPSWVKMTLTQTELDMAPPGGTGFQGYTFEKTKDLLSEFDKNVAEGRPLIANVSDEDLQVPWTLKRGGQVLMTMPRYSILRSMVINHSVHHRAQLGLYLRMVDLPVPKMYGPTADEKW